jgi:uncharacterized protein YcaQ
VNNDAVFPNDPERAAEAEAAEAQEAIARIAARILGVGTLDLRHRDRLDFHELSVDGLRRALEAAYEAGRAAAAYKAALEGAC